MALTKISGSILKDPLNLGEVSIGGTLTYQDVTNVDSVGVITARSGIKVLAGGINAVGVITATSFVGSGANLTGITGTTINNNADNRVITGSGTANTLNGEANLTFNGTTLDLNGTANILKSDSTGFHVLIRNTNNTDGNHAELRFQGTNSSNGGYTTARIIATNLDNYNQYSNLRFFTHSLGSTTEKLRINASGQLIVTGGGQTNSSYGLFQVNQAADNDEGGIAILNDANTRSMRIYVDASGNSVINSGDGGSATLILNEGTGDVIVGDNLLPDADNDQDLGSSSKRWANIYTADLQLSNKGNTNDVDGTWGQYIIQEGKDDLFLINKRNGKKYKFMLEEVN